MASNTRANNDNLQGLNAIKLGSFGLAASLAFILLIVGIHASSAPVFNNTVFAESHGPVIAVSPNVQNVTSGGQILINGTIISCGCGNDTLQWFNVTSGTPVLIPGATSLNYNATAGATGSFFYFIRITDSENATNQSNTSARVNVAAKVVKNSGPFIIQSDGGLPGTSTTVQTTTVVTTTISGSANNSTANDTNSTIPISIIPEVTPINNTSGTKPNTTLNPGNVPANVPITITGSSGKSSGGANHSIMTDNLYSIFLLIGIILAIIALIFRNGIIK